jgi:cob(I)alamin adenosyltransferase
MNMRIYTKTGDLGETSLGNGSRVPKDEARIEANGDLDELNAALGLVRSQLKGQADIQSLVLAIQKDLFLISAEVSQSKGKAGFSEDRLSFLERTIDAYESRLSPIKEFITPGESVLGSHVHVARTICRRAERRVVGLASTQEVSPHILSYLNRLSDLLFVMARFVDYAKGSVK